jgi:hypothetical protein
MSKTLDYVRESILHETSISRRDGPPLYLLDKLNSREKKIIENELIVAADSADYWLIAALGYLKSHKALPKLYQLLEEADDETIKIDIASAIYCICGDSEMVQIALDELDSTMKTNNEDKLVSILYKFHPFEDERISQRLFELLDSPNYLVAYNAAIALDISTDNIVIKFGGNPYK